MCQFKANKGITFVALVITVIILLILSGIGIYMGINATTRAKDSKLISELGMIQHAILEQYTKYKVTRDETTLVGIKMEEVQVQEIATKLGITLVTIPNQYSNKDYYRLDKASLLTLGITHTSDEYIINYITGEVINITKEKTSQGEVLYSKSNSLLDD